MSAEFKRHPIDKFPMRLVRHRVNCRITGIGIVAVNQYRHDNAAPGLRQTPRELRLRREFVGDAGYHFRCPVCIRQGDDLRDRFADRFQEEPLAFNFVKNGPADARNDVSLRF